MMDWMQQWAFGTDYLVVDWVVLTLLILSAFMIIRIRDLLASAVMLGIFSLLTALLYLLLDAPDVALTEAAVGAGISTLLFLCTLTFTEREQSASPSIRRTVAFMVVLVVGSALLFATNDLPAFNADDAPIHQHVAPYYIEHMQEDIDIPNLVTAILGGYRGFDTLGETGVIFTAGIAITALLMNIPQMRPTTPAPQQAPVPTQPAAAEKPKRNSQKTPPRRKKVKSAGKKPTNPKKPATPKKGGKKA